VGFNGFKGNSLNKEPSLIIVSSDKQRIDHWKSVSGMPAKVTTNLADIEKWTVAGEKTVLVDMSAFTEADKIKLEQLIDTHRDVGFFVFVAIPEEKDGIRWIRAGAKGYGNRLMNDVVMEAALSAMNDGEIWASKLVVQYLLNRLQASGLTGSVTGLSMLTAREHELAEVVSQGLNNKEISEKFGISERTVKAHLNKIFKKMNVSSRVQLALEIEKAKAERAQITYN
jgi:DNA-binding NarL/FixJ family response regulator